MIFAVQTKIKYSTDQNFRSLGMWLFKEIIMTIS
jgi:hypothetical protein